MTVSFRQYWALLVPYLHPQKGRVILLTLLLLISVSLQLINPQIIRRFIDTAMSGNDAITQATSTSPLLMMALLFIGIAIGQQVVAVVVAYIGENIGWTATNWLRYDLARHTLYLDMSFHNNHQPGEMIVRLDDDVSLLSKFFSQLLSQIATHTLLLIGILVLLFRESIWVGIALTLWVIVISGTFNWMRTMTVPYWQQARKAWSTYWGYLEEWLGGTEDIRASGAERYIMRRFFELLQTAWSTRVKAFMIGSVRITLGQFLFAVGTAIAFIIGATLYQSGEMTLGTVYLIAHYTGMLSNPIERISKQFEQLERGGAVILRIQELLQTESKIPDERLPQTQFGSFATMNDPMLDMDVLPVLSGPLSVRFEQVSFAYPTNKNNNADGELALQDISFQLQPGRVLGLLGHTGSGKTTVTRLLFRLYEPTAGDIAVGGTNMQEMPVAHLRQSIGLVTQDVQLFHATVRDNLTFFDRTIVDDAILQILQELGLGTWLDSLDQGLDTVLSGGESGLSAGQAQLLAFARVFLKDPGLIILDEASSRLDPATERLIGDALNRLLANRRRTAIIIAHRLETIQAVDDIMLLDKGRMLEYGPRETLANTTSSHFHRLLQTGLAEVLT
ncbi:MAG: ABC transporter ATP-binding protein [Chloroflexota bacterium]